ncbi:MAG: DUF3810 domain-containing protein [Clostridia bacterium]|nr:DUF3810 domain-containing protein [Clostridia bacterium]
MALTKTERFKRRFERYVPWIFPVSAALAAATLILHVVSRRSPAVADAVNLYWGGPLRALAATVTGIVPFSLAEGLLLFSPVLLVVFIALAVKLTRRSLRAGVRYIFVLLSVLCLLWTLFMPMLGVGSSASPLSDRLGLSEEKVSAEQLAETMRWAVEEANRLCGEVDFRFAGFSAMPFDSYGQMCEDLMTGYARLHQEHPIFLNIPSRVKPVILSEPMSYTHITGIYTFFTGEANLNVNFPDYTLPFTAAHELAHQRGFAREKEANFIAFLVCVKSDDPYTRYSGYINMVEYLSGPLYSADREAWQEIWNSLDVRIRYEMQAYDAFFEKYRDNVAADVSGAVNDAYLKGQGQQDGTRSYGLVVDLAVAYYYSVIRGTVDAVPGA